MKILIDTCILMDYLQNRVPFADYSEKVLELALMNRFTPYFTAKAVTDVNYIMRRCCSNSQEKKLLTAHLWQLFTVVDTCSEDAFNAMFSPMDDYEDAVMVETAKRMGFDAIVTRNGKDYKGAGIPVFSPEDIINRFA